VYICLPLALLSGERERRTRGREISDEQIWLLVYQARKIADLLKLKEDHENTPLISSHLNGHTFTKISSTNSKARTTFHLYSGQTQKNNVISGFSEP